MSISAQFDRATQLTPVIAEHTRTGQQSTPGATYDRSVPIVGGPATRALQVVDGRCLFGSDQDIRFQPVESGRGVAFHRVAQHRLDDLGHPHHVGTDALQSRDRCETAGLDQPLRLGQRPVSPTRVAASVVSGQEYVTAWIVSTRIHRARAKSVCILSRNDGGQRRMSYSWTQTGMPSGMMLLSQIQSIAAGDTRTQPCEAG